VALATRQVAFVDVVAKTPVGKMDKATMRARFAGMAVPAGTHVTLPAG
jgi:non-ribosomal peptide synthetase component E (peptide arylation enzyme)